MHEMIETRVKKEQQVSMTAYLENENDEKNKLGAGFMRYFIFMGIYLLLKHCFYDLPESFLFAHFFIPGNLMVHQ